MERNVIAKNTIIVGEIKSDGDFRIDGTLEGNLIIKGNDIEKMSYGFLLILKIFAENKNNFKFLDDYSKNKGLNNAYDVLSFMMNFGTIKEINWDQFIRVIVFKTIPLFWIPAHTITFLMPIEYRVIFAAILGIFLGLILGVFSNKK